MDFSVTTISRGLIAPSGPTPSGVLELSMIDKLHVLRCNARTLHVFRHGPGAAQVIRKALSKALVPYYPLAGRLHVSDQHELQIACSGEGVWFVEATADCTLDAVHYFDDAITIPYDKLLPIPLQENDGLDPLVQMQVTEFRCGGFVIGLIFCHSICDGLGAAQFLKAIGEFAKGAQQLTLNPKWCRNFFPPPHHHHINQLTTTTMPPNIPNYQLQHSTIDITLDRINDLKKIFQQSNINGSKCSTFELVAAMLWKHRTRAIDLKNDAASMNLVFFANCRQLIPLPAGFYGNCFFPVTVTAAAGKLTSSSVFDVVKMIQEAKAGLPDQFGKWIRDTGTGTDPFAPPLEYTTLFISEWGRLGFNQVDYGWGNPTHVVPVQGSSIIPVGIVCTQPYPKMGVRLMTWCVHQTHLQDLLHQINNIH